MRTRIDRTQHAASPVLTVPVRLVLSLLLGATVATVFMDGEAAAIVTAVAALTGMSAASWLFISRSQTLASEERRAWRLFGIGLGTGALGLAVHATVLVVTGDVPVFGPIDFIWLTGYLILITGLARLPHSAGSTWQRARLFIDGVIGAVAVGALLWTFSIGDLTAQLSEGGVWERFVGSAYIFLDSTVLVLLMIVVVRRSTYRFDMRLVLIGVAGVTHLVSDYLFLTSGLGKSFAEAEPAHPISILSIALFAAAAAIVDRKPAKYEYAYRTKTPWWALAFPYSFAVVMVVAMFVRTTLNPWTDGGEGLLNATFVVLALVVTRQAVSIRENQRLIEDQRTTLVSSISHELRTPLTSVVGFLELLDGDSLDDTEERREVTAIANHQAQYLGRIVSDLVMLASDTMTNMELKIAPTPVDSFTWAAINAAAIDPSLVQVDAERNVTAFLDQGRMEQAVANLLVNAVRYGGENVFVVAKADGGDLLLEVHDDGPGVPRKYELMIWEKFERGLNRFNAIVPGSGIGLAVTNAIAKGHGGSAGYRRSDRLGGACFWIRLPGRVREEKAATQGASPHLTVVEGDAQTA